MKIVCPTCEATYEVPESVLTSKRQVRCARCTNDWVPGDSWDPAQGTATVPVAAAPAEAAPEPAPAIARVAEAEPPSEAPPPAALPETVPAPAPEPQALELTPAAVRLRQSAASAFGEPAAEVPAPEAVTRAGTPVGAWIASVIVLVLFFGAAVVFRAPVMKVWPPSERVYAALGLDTGR